MDRRVIKESVSPVIYHFCPISVMYVLAKYDTFNLTENGKRRSDAWMNDKGNGTTHEYYMSVSRNGYSGVGYAQLNRSRKTGDWGTCLVRLKLNADLINSDFQGKAVNAFNDINSKVVNKKKNINAPVNYIQKGSDSFGQRTFDRSVSDDEAKIIDRNQLSEYEDRIFSDEPTIDNFSRYIERIDILFTTSTYGKKVSNISDIYSEIGFIKNKFPDRTFIYTSEKAFNMQSSLEIAKSKNSMDRTEKEDTMLYKYKNVNDEFFSKYKQEINAPLDEFYLYDKEIAALSEVSGLLCALYDNSVGDVSVYDIANSMGFEKMRDGEKKKGLFISMTKNKEKQYSNSNAYGFYADKTSNKVENISAIIPAFKGNFVKVLNTYKERLFTILSRMYATRITKYGQALQVVFNETPYWPWTINYDLDKIKGGKIAERLIVSYVPFETFAKIATQKKPEWFNSKVNFYKNGFGNYLYKESIENFIGNNNIEHLTGKQMIDGYVEYINNKFWKEYRMNPNEKFFENTIKINTDDLRKMVIEVIRKAGF